MPVLGHCAQNVRKNHRRAFTGEGCVRAVRTSGRPARAGRTPMDRAGPGSLRRTQATAKVQGPRIGGRQPAPLPMPSTMPSPWATVRDARDQLGVSEKTLSRWRAAGLLKAGEHWRRKFPSPNSPVLYRLDQCEAAMNEATARSAHLLEPSVVRSADKKRSAPSRTCRQRQH